MNTYVVEVIKKYKQQGILIDSNAALLYVVGSFDISLIAQVKRTSNFTINQFHTISAFIDLFSKRVTTAHVLTEMSNLLPIKLLDGLTRIIHDAEEKLKPAKDLAADQSFLSYGLADASVVDCARQGYLVLTDDKALLGYIRSERLDAVEISDLE